jgi:hypothetical protein
VVGAARAQTSDFPKTPVRFIIPSAPGRPAGLAARVAKEVPLWHDVIAKSGMELQQGYFTRVKYPRGVADSVTNRDKPLCYRHPSGGRLR